MRSTVEVLEELEQYVQHQREEGEPDLRSVLWAIGKLKGDPDFVINEESE